MLWGAAADGAELRLCVDRMHVTELTLAYLCAWALQGGAILSTGTLTVMGCTFSGNKAVRQKPLLIPFCAWFRLWATGPEQCMGVWGRALRVVGRLAGSRGVADGFSCCAMHKGL